MTNFNLQHKTRSSLNVAIVAVVLVVVLGFILTGPVTLSDFRNNLWGPAHLLVNGQSPYRLDVLFDGSQAVWLPMVIGALFPLGWLNLNTASSLWLVVNISLLIIPVVLCARENHPSVWRVAGSLFVIFLFPPTLANLALGQFTIIITLVWIIVFLYGDGLPLWLNVFLIVVALSKPQMSVLTLPVYLVDYVRRNQRAQTMTLFLLFALWTLVSTIPLFLGYAAWIPDFIAALAHNPTWDHPSLFTVLPQQIGTTGYVIWGLLAAGLFGSSIYLWFRCPRSEAMLWSLALTPLVTPYIWSYDFVMVLPLFVKTLLDAKSKLALGCLWGGFTLTWVLHIKVSAADTISDQLYWWMPWLCAGTIGVSLLAERYAANKITSLESR